VSKQIIIDVQQEQIRVAFLEEGDLVEMHIEDYNQQRVVGNIYRGRVANVLPGMQAAFVDIGLEKNAFLYVGDINTDKTVFEFAGSSSRVEEGLRSPSIRDLLKEGQELTVQVLKEPIGTKGARVTTHITLPGRYMVLMPTVNYIGVSRRIEDEAERQRLKEITEGIKPETMGIIVRTEAQRKDRSDFLPDVEFLVRLWEKIKERERRGRGRIPRLLHKDESIIYRIIRDLFTGDVKKLIINDGNEYQKILEWVNFISPGMKDRIEYFQSNRSIFEAYGIEDKIEKIIQKKVWLKNGAHIIIESTEALTAIDVNTGKYVGGVSLEETVLSTNLEAAEEIARQIRLRDLSGIIIIDFIDMEAEEHRQRVLEVLKSALKRDRTKTNVLGFTGLGLVEMTRKKVRNRLSQSLLKPCPYCSGTGKVYSENMILAKLERELERVTQDGDLYGVLVEIHPAVAKLWLEEDGRGLEALEGALSCKILLRTNRSLHLEEPNLLPIRTREEAKDLLQETDSIYTMGYKFS
jgi:ribonuclease G